MISDEIEIHLPYQRGLVSTKKDPKGETKKHDEDKEKSEVNLLKHFHEVLLLIVDQHRQVGKDLYLRGIMKDSSRSDRQVWT